MSEKSNNRKKELEHFLRYSQDQMSEAERNAFERSLEQDPFDAEAMEGLSSISPEEARADLARLQDQVQKRVTGSSKINRDTRTMWYRVAAAVAVLLVVSSVLFTLFNDRMGQLDRNVAESPEAEMEEPFVESTPVQRNVVHEEADAPEKEKSSLLKSVAGETEILADTETGVKDEAITKESIEEEVAREKIADVQLLEAEVVAISEFAAEEGADIKATVPAQAEEIHADEDAAPEPAMALERQATTKSRKRETVEQSQMAGAVAAEQRTISGMVISGEDEQPLPGVVVAVKGSNTGTVTDMEGKFEISIKDDPNNTLLAQFIGMETKEILIQDREEFMITLEPDAISLEEVVIIGTAPTRSVHLTGSTVKVADYPEEDLDYRSATPVGGKKEFNEYFKSNIQFPEQDAVITKAVVVLNFIVGNDGRPAQIFVLKSPGKAFSNEATRLLMEGPDWQPAEKNGNYYEQSNRIRILFKKERP
jgi:hypothetical protein